jgi:hypothetical protein
MSTVLYYSNFCEHSKKLLITLSKSRINSEIHFICIDKREKINNDTYIILNNGQKMLMPKNLNNVPALFSLSGAINGNIKILYGQDIYNFLAPRQEEIVTSTTNNNMEPECFTFNGCGGNNLIASDKYSYVDMSDDSLSAKGDGGLRQMYEYALVDESNLIKASTPNDNYSSTKERQSNDESNNKMKQMEEERAKDLQFKHMQQY